MPMLASILIPSFGRPPALTRCLGALALQTRRSDEIIVVWQSDDTATRDAALALRPAFGDALRVLHIPGRGIVPAENAALAAAKGEIILLIDDDAVAPPDWILKHLAFYADPTVGAVGGPAVNRHADNTPLPIRSNEPSGRLAWYGKLHGNLHDHPSGWRNREPRKIDHLVGYNMSLRRAAFDQFEQNLRAYWQLFELDACLQVKRRGFSVVLDYSNVIDHFPTGSAYVPGRDGDLALKVYNGAYNHAFILAKHAPLWQWPPILLYLLAVGSMNGPGVLASLVAARRFGDPLRETRIFFKTLQSRFAGFRDGWRAR